MRVWVLRETGSKCMAETSILPLLLGLRTECAVGIKAKEEEFKYIYFTSVGMKLSICKKGGGECR